MDRERRVRVAFGILLRAGCQVELIVFRDRLVDVNGRVAIFEWAPQRALPTAESEERAGGAGVGSHVDVSEGVDDWGRVGADHRRRGESAGRGA